MTVIVTGAAHGLGRELALACAARSDAVLGVDRDGDARADRVGVTPLAVDLRAGGAADRIVEHVNDPVTAVFHSAGISGAGRFEDIDAGHHEHSVRLTFEVPVQLTRALLAAGVCAGDARHVFIGSLSTFTGYPGAVSYAASKDAIASFARSLDAALDDEMSAHCAFPGPLRTDHAARYAPDNSPRTVARRQDPADAAAAILADVERGRRRIYPSAGARAFAVAGRVAPGLTNRVMRRSVYDRLTTPRV